MWDVYVWFQILPVAFFLALGYGVGSLRERRHLKSLNLREQAFSDMAVSSLKRVPAPESVAQASGAAARAAELVLGG